MSILETVSYLRSLVVQTGDYRSLADSTGVSYHWLQKFACGLMSNPTVQNLAKVEAYFKKGGKWPSS